MQIHAQYMQYMQIHAFISFDQCMYLHVYARICMYYLYKCMYIYI
jgi:hypothetical protein